MKITKKEDFSLIFMGFLAENYREKFIPLSSISIETNISVLFLKHIASDLLHRKLVISREGIGGGYRLSKDPKKIMIGQILWTDDYCGIKLPCLKTACRIKKDTCRCKSLWKKINTELNSYLQNISLWEFIRK